MGDITLNDNSEQLINDVEQQLEQFLHRVLLKIKNTAEDILSTEGNGKKYPTNTTHELRKNLREDVYREAGKLIGVVGVGENVPYSIFVHEGTKPHRPPTLAIEQWILDKGFLKTGEKKVKRGYLRQLSGRKAGFTGQALTSEVNRIKGIAFLIARKIAAHGTQAVPYLRLALNQNLDWIVSEFQNLKTA
jgi:hypothetical protein